MEKFSLWINGINKQQRESQARYEEGTLPGFRNCSMLSETWIPTAFKVCKASIIKIYPPPHLLAFVFLN